MHPVHTVLFDLDGTISDAAPGIINGLKHAMEKIGVPVEEDHDWTPYLGPPLPDALRDVHGLAPARADAAMGAYLDYYRSRGLFENELYAGIPELVDDLRAQGTTIAVATSKRAFLAERILEHFGLRDRFAVIGGARADGSGGRKHEVIVRALDELGIDHDGRGIAMVGDRAHDIYGARNVGLVAVGVRWGYAPPGELEAAGADLVVDTVADLAAALLPSPA
ncbi:MAG: HAD hydrolase-like protein [Actinobacteria bacterium]|nr:HAD hydrolase-like protein [Actinomycetota bacterium]